MRRDWHKEQIRLLRSIVTERHFYMGLTAFGAITGITMGALGIDSGDPGSYSGPAAFVGGMLGLRKSPPNGE